jgi:hypothetical protein
VSEAPARRGSVVLYLLGFASLLVAGMLLGYGGAIDFLEHLGWLWASIAASALAAILAILGLVAGRKG